MEINKIINQDCLIGFNDFPDKSVDLICTDPPYRITSRGLYGNCGGMLKNKKVMTGKVFEHNNCNVNDWMPQLYRVLKDGSHAYIMCNHINLIEYLNVAVKCGFHFIKSLIWDKKYKIMGTAYMSQFEYILFFRKGQFKQVNDCGISDIISIPNDKPKDENGNNLHDTPKPVELMKILIEQSTDKGDIVLDPFMGIGSTAIASVLSERKYVGFELDPKYYDIACRRIEEAERSKSSKNNDALF